GPARDVVEVARICALAEQAVENTRGGKLALAVLDTELVGDGNQGSPLRRAGTCATVLLPAGVPLIRQRVVDREAGGGIGVVGHVRAQILGAVLLSGRDVRQAAAREVAGFGAWAGLEDALPSPAARPARFAAVAALGVQKQAGPTNRQDVGGYGRPQGRR